MRFNLALAKLHSELAADAASPDDSRYRATFRHFATRRPGLALRTIRSAPWHHFKSPDDLTSPADGPGAVGLTPSFPNPDTVEFCFNPPNAKVIPTLRFIRVGSADEPNRFVATSELSVGLFMQAVNQYGDWKQMERLIPLDAMSDGRLCPCVWKWKAGRMQVADAW